MAQQGARRLTVAQQGAQPAAVESSHLPSVVLRCSMETRWKTVGNLENLGKTKENLWKTIGNLNFQKIYGKPMDNLWKIKEHLWKINKHHH